MNNSTPQVSIIMATYNRAHFIQESIEAICGQTYVNWECLIIDDGSSDDSEEIIRQFLNKDHRIKFFKRTGKYKKGLPGCRNYGLDMANGKYVVFMDDDDIAHPQLLEFCIEEMEKQNVEYCHYLRTTFMGDFNRTFQEIKVYSISKLENETIVQMITGKLPFNSCQVLWRKSCFDDIRYDENLMFAEEWECYSRILLNEAKGISLNKILYHARKHPHSNTGEYQQKNNIRIRSYIDAALQIIENLSKKRYFNSELKSFFVRLGVELKSPKIIRKSLEAAESGKMEKFKYQIGYKLYPLLKPVFYFKGKILKN